MADETTEPDNVPKHAVEMIGSYWYGMTMRQWYKGMALQGYLAAGNKIEPVHIGRRTKLCGLFADAMIEEDELHAKGTNDAA